MASKPAFSNRPTSLCDIKRDAFSMDIKVNRSVYIGLSFENQQHLGKLVSELATAIYDAIEPEFLSIVESLKNEENVAETETEKESPTSSGKTAKL